MGQLRENGTAKHVLGIADIVVAYGHTSAERPDSGVASGHDEQGATNSLLYTHTTCDSALCQEKVTRNA